MADKERKKEVSVSSWHPTGELQVIDGVNGAARVYSVSFSAGLGKEWQQLDPLARRSFAQAIREHKSVLLQDPDVGPRELNLHDFAVELVEQLDERR